MPDTASTVCLTPLDWALCLIYQRGGDAARAGCRPARRLICRLASGRVDRAWGGGLRTPASLACSPLLFTFSARTISRTLSFYLQPGRRPDWQGDQHDLGGVRVGLGHRFAAAWVRVRAAFGDLGRIVVVCYPRDDPSGS